MLVEEFKLPIDENNDALWLTGDQSSMYPAFEPEQDTWNQTNSS